MIFIFSSDLVVSKLNKASVINNKLMRLKAEGQNYFFAGHFLYNLRAVLKLRAY